MDKTLLEVKRIDERLARAHVIDSRIRRECKIDRSETCFKGTGIFSESDPELHSKLKEKESTFRW